MWFIFIFILWSSIGIYHIAFFIFKFDVYSFFIVEGSLSSSKVRKKVEANKLKSTEGIAINSDQLHRTLKAGVLLNLWLFYIMLFCCISIAIFTIFVLLKILSLPWYSWTYIYQTTNLVQSPRHRFFDMGHSSKSWGRLSIPCAETT